MKRERILRPLIVSFTLILGTVGMTGCSADTGVAAQVDGKVIPEAQVEQLTTEVGQFFHESEVPMTAMRIQALDTLIYKEVVFSHFEEGSPEREALSGKKIREELKSTATAQCEDGKAQLEMFSDDEAAVNEEQKAQLEEAVNSMCEMTSLVDGLSDDAAMYYSLSQIKQQQQMPLIYPELGNIYPDTEVTVSPRYGEIVEGGVYPAVPRSVFFPQ